MTQSNTDTLRSFFGETGVATLRQMEANLPELANSGGRLAFRPTFVALLNSFDRICNFLFGALDGLLQPAMAIDASFQLFRHLSINLGWLSC